MTTRARAFVTLLAGGAFSLVLVLAFHFVLTFCGLGEIEWIGYLQYAIQGALLGVLLTWAKGSYPALAGFFASLMVPVVIFLRVGYQVSLDLVMDSFLTFEAHFASLTLAAFVVFAVRGGGLRYSRFMGYRFLRYKVVSIVSVVGVAFGVASLSVALCITHGFEKELQSKIVGTYAHGMIMKQVSVFDEYRGTIEKAKRVKGVVAATPILLSEVMIRARKQISSCMLMGIDLDSIHAVSQIPLDEGSLRDLDKPGAPGVIIGRELQSILKVRLGDSVDLLTTLGENQGLVSTLPRARTFRVAGVFHTGMYEFDAKSVYVTLKQSQEFLKMGDSVFGIALRFTDLEQSRKILDDIIAVLDGFPFYGRTWSQMYGNLFSILKLQKICTAIIFIIVIIVSIFGVVATLVMMVWEKIREIAILKSMGATADGVMKIFMVVGASIGSLGTVLGMLLGYGVCSLLSRFDMRLDSEVYYVEKLPVIIDPVQLLLVAMVALHICFIATIYPSKRAAAMLPVEGLRYE
jgi:lipoprotein-releasing system permease protein